jgi:3-oxoacyl-(acyl-carrier-protein) synthase
MRYSRKVVITGAGLLSPLGKNTDENWKNMMDMKTGIGFYPEEGKLRFLQYKGKVNSVEIPEDINPKLMGR